nr:hypothetical protein [Fulvimarina pelagi]
MMLFAIFLVLTGGIAHVLAFLLPLKVILLAGSTGIPSYFTPIVSSPEYKTELIVALSFAAVICYVLGLTAEAGAKKQSQKVGAHIGSVRNDEPDDSELDEVSDLVHQFVSLTADILFTLLALAAFALMNPPLGAYIVAVATGGVLIFGALRTRVTVGGETLGERALRDTSNIIKLCASIIFFGGFFAILLPLFFTENPNILIAIISFVVFRRALSALSSVVRQTVKFGTNRASIDETIVYEDEQKEAMPSSTLSVIFSKDARELRIRELLSDSLDPDDHIDVHWTDTGPRDVSLFEIAIQRPSENEPSTLYIQAVIPRGPKNLLDRERELFKELEHEKLCAPAFVAEFQEGDFDCRIMRVGESVRASREQRRDAFNRIFTRIWSVEPPRSLQADPEFARPRIVRVLKDSFCRNAALAAESDSDRHALANFLRLRPSILEVVEQAPCYIHNPDMNANTIYPLADGEAIQPIWSRWSIEPMGTTLPTPLSVSEIEASLELVRENRPSIPSDFTTNHLLLIDSMTRLMQLLSARRYRASIDLMKRVIENPVVIALSNPEQTSLNGRSSRPVQAETSTSSA